jgi:hypothetical protein
VLSCAGPPPAFDIVADRRGCFFERLRLCPGAYDEAEADEPGGEVSLGSVLGASVLEDTRPRRFLTAPDLERLCLRGG